MINAAYAAPEAAKTKAEKHEKSKEGSHFRRISLLFYEWT